MIDYTKLSIIAVILCVTFGSGWFVRNKDYQEYKKEQKIIAEQQEAKVESIKQQQALVNKGIQDEYDAKLALLRKYYADGVRQPSSGTMPSISTAKSLADATTAYTILAGQCAETTLMLVELQKWLNEQIGINAK